VSFSFLLFLYNSSGTRMIYSLSLHDALPIWERATSQTTSETKEGKSGAGCRRSLAPGKRAKTMEMILIIIGKAERQTITTSPPRHHLSLFGAVVLGENRTVTAPVTPTATALDDTYHSLRTERSAGIDPAREMSSVSTFS